MLCEAIGWCTGCGRQWLTRIMAGRYGLIQQVEALRDRAMWGAGQHRAHGRPPYSGCSLKVPAWSAPSSSILGEKAETRGFPPLRVGCQSGTAQGAFTYSYITAHVLVYIPTRAEQWPPPRKPPLPDTNSIHRRRRLQCLPRSVGREAAQALTMELIPRTKGHPLTPESDVPCRGVGVCGVGTAVADPDSGVWERPRRSQGGSGLAACIISDTERTTHELPSVQLPVSRIIAPCRHPDAVPVVSLARDPSRMP
jgi:hypothetical protein